MSTLMNSSCWNNLEQNQTEPNRTKQRLKIQETKWRLSVTSAPTASSWTDRPSVNDSAVNMCERQSQASCLQMRRRQQLLQLGCGKAAWRGVQGHLPLPGFISGKHERPHMAPCGQQWPGWGADYPLFWRIRTPAQPPHGGQRLTLTEGCRCVSLCGERWSFLCLV